MIPRLLKPGLTMFPSGPSRRGGARRYLSPSPCCGVAAAPPLKTSTTSHITATIQL